MQCHIDLDTIISEDQEIEQGLTGVFNAMVAHAEAEMIGDTLDRIWGSSDYDLSFSARPDGYNHSFVYTLEIVVSGGDSFNLVAHTDGSVVGRQA